MFNGIIEELGEVMSIKVSAGREFTIKAFFSDELSMGDSVAVNGVCTTVISQGKKEFQVFASEETLSITNLAKVEEGGLVNLERSLIYGNRISGHMVSGHVDKTVPLIKTVENTESWLFTFALSLEDHKLIIPKGSVALNGISLTVYRLDLDWFTVMVIPHTYHHTNLSALKVGDNVNCEFDSLGKFIQQHVKSYLSGGDFSPLINK